MARKVRGFPSYPDVMDLDSFMCNGVQRCEAHYTGCRKCPSTWEEEPYFEISCKRRKKYPVCNYTNQISSSDIASQSFAVHLKHLQVSKSIDGQAQNLDKCVITKPNTHEVEKIFSKLEMYTSSLKSKLKTYKENERSSCKAKSRRQKHMQSSALNSSPPIHTVSTSESSDDEITEVIEESEELAQKNERSTSKTEPVREKHVLSSGVDSSPADLNVSTSINLVRTSESRDDEKNEENEELVQESPDELVQETPEELVQETHEELLQESHEELLQETPKFRKEQSLNSSSEHSSDSFSLNYDEVLDRSTKSCETNKGIHVYESNLSELEGHLSSNRSSSLGEGKATNKNISCGMEDKSKMKKSQKRLLSDSEEQQSSADMKHPTSIQKASLLSTSSEFCEEHRSRECQRPGEFENTELSLYETVNETFSQAPEALESCSSGSETP